MLKYCFPLLFKIKIIWSDQAGKQIPHFRVIYQEFPIYKMATLISCSQWDWSHILPSTKMPAITLQPTQVEV